MSEQATGDKTEKASPQKLKKAREQGQVARSKDVSTAVGLLVALKLTVWLMPGYLADFRLMFALCLTDLSEPGALQRLGGELLPVVFGLLIRMMLPLLAIPLAVVTASALPGGLVLHFGGLAPQLSRLSPLTNLRRLVSAKHAAELLVSVGKACALGWLLWHLGLSGVQAHVRLQSLPLGEALLGGAELLSDGVLAMCAVFLAFALVDVPVQRFLFLRGQRMTKQEVKDEHKNQEGRPEVRQRMRQLQRALVQRSIRKAVPTADVVVVNPEHYAVALKYDERRAEAPFVVAKGVDEMAFEIRRVAAGHGVEVVPLPPLARALYHTSQVNQQIPAPLYRAVALVLTYVLQIQAFQQGRRPSQPALPTDLGVPEHLTRPPA